MELKGTEGIIRNDIPEADIIGTADSEAAYWQLMKEDVPDLVLLDLGLGGSTTVGVEICRHTRDAWPNMKILILPVRFSMRSYGWMCSMPVPMV